MYNYVNYSSYSKLIRAFILSLLFAACVGVKAIDVTVKVENLAPSGGAYLTPMFMNFHDGTFDPVNPGEQASPGLQSLAEDGAVSALTDEFNASISGGAAGVTSGGPIAPGESRSITFDLSEDGSNRFFNFVSMVIPSNDAFIANDDPEAHPVFDEDGHFVGGSFMVLGSQVFDAGTEVNDEIPMNTAFLGQTTPDTGEDENGTIGLHPGHMPVGSGGILDDPMFANADFSAEGYRMARITISPPVEVTVSVENLAPPGGAYLTPMFMGFHDGSFDPVSPGESASSGIQNLAEDGVVGILMDEFDASGAGTITGVTSGGPIAPGESRQLTFSLSPKSENRYFSWAAMVIPSNDAFVANASPVTHPVFDENGNFLGGSFIVLGSSVLDAGTEVNDEMPENTAFFGQTTPNTGEDENGTIGIHPGYLPAGSGGVLDDPMFASADFKALDYRVARITIAQPANVTVAVENRAPRNGSYLTPMLLSFHNGAVDPVTEGVEASPGLQSLSEDGVVSGLAGELEEAQPGLHYGTTTGGPIAPFERRAASFSLTPTEMNRYFSFAAMVIPSNDAFVSNDDPTAHPVFDEAGRFVGGTFSISGSSVFDAGTEVNDESPANTAFFGQTTPNTGMDENGVIHLHSGFNPPENGGILADPMFAGADFKADGYQVTRVFILNSPLITGTMLEDGDIGLEWVGGNGPFTIQRKAEINSAEWADLLTTMDSSASLSAFDTQGYLRVNNAVRFTAVLTGSAERPDPIDVPASGWGTLTLHGHELSVDLHYRDLSGSATQAHIHGPADIDAGAGVLIGLTELHEGPLDVSGRFSGSLALNDAQLQSLLDGKTYVNIHTEQHPGGELRGQILR